MRDLTRLHYAIGAGILAALALVFLYIFFNQPNRAIAPPTALTADGKPKPHIIESCSGTHAFRLLDVHQEVQNPKLCRFTKIEAYGHLCYDQLYCGSSNEPRVCKDRMPPNKDLEAPRFVETNSFTPEDAAKIKMPVTRIYFCGLPGNVTVTLAAPAN
jgi:hypothetical protein